MHRTMIQSAMTHLAARNTSSNRQSTLQTSPPGVLVRRPGMALLVVTVLTMLIALAAYRFSFYMESQYRVARLNEEQLQARLAALSGLEYAAYLLEQPHANRLWQHSSNDGQPNSLAAVPLQVEPELQAAGAEETTAWRFSLIAPALATEPGDLQSSQAAGRSRGGNAADELYHRFGLENESAKIPIPLLLQWERATPGTARSVMLRLPGATPLLVDQWLRQHGIASTSSPTSSGSSIDTLAARSGRLGNDIGNDDIGGALGAESVDLNQLQWLWYGGDLNQNYRLDPLELQLRGRLFNDFSGRELGVEPVASAIAESSIPQGWNRFLTWTSGQRNESSAGNRRINLNGSDLGQLHRQLLRSWPIEWANFVVALRQYGPATSLSSTSTISAAELPLDLARPSTFQLSSLLDLVDAHVVIGDSTSEKQTVHSSFSSDLASASNYLARLLDEACLGDQPFIAPAIDIHSAPLEVLAAIPSMGADLAQSIVQRRTSLDATRKATMAWLYTDQLISMAQLRELYPYIIGRSDVFSVQAVGFRDSRSPVARYTATIDARHQPARILRQQQWHPWDHGFDMSSFTQRREQP